MPLRITLKPHERVIINGAMIRNGDRNSYILVETQCRFLRESDFVDEAGVHTPCRKICLVLQNIHLAENSAESKQEFFLQAKDIKRHNASLGMIISEIEQALLVEQTYLAVKIGKKLLIKEWELLASS